MIIIYFGMIKIEFTGILLTEIFNPLRYKVLCFTTISSSTNDFYLLFLVNNIIKFSFFFNFNLLEILLLLFSFNVFSNLLYFSLCYWFKFNFYTKIDLLFLRYFIHYFSFFLKLSLGKIYVSISIILYEMDLLIEILKNNNIYLKKKIKK